MSTQTHATHWGLYQVSLTPLGYPRVFANGRQQVHIEVRLQCATRHDVISDTELGSCRLIHTQRSTVLPAPPATVASNTWYSSETESGYEAYPDFLVSGTRAERPVIKSGAVRTNNNGIYYKDFYVSGTALTRLDVAVEITRSDGYRYRTNGEGDNGVSPSANLLIEPVRPPLLGPDSFIWERVRVAGSESEQAIDTVDNWYLAAQYGAEQVNLRSMALAPASMIKWRNPMGGETFASYTGFAQPGADRASFSADIIRGGSHRVDPVVRRPRPGEGVVIMVRRGDVPFYSGGQYEPSEITALDAFGNEHRLRVRFLNGTDRNRLELIAR